MKPSKNQITKSIKQHLLQETLPPEGGRSLPAAHFPPELLHDWPKHDEDGLLIIDTHVPNYALIYSVALEIELTEATPYQWDDLEQTKAKRVVCNMPNLISALNQLARTRPIWTDVYCPRVSLFLSTFDSLLIGIERFDVPTRIYCRQNATTDRATEEKDNRPTFELVNDFAQTIRRITRTITFKRKESNWRGRFQYRIDSAEIYVDSLFATYSRLLTIRIDFYPERLESFSILTQPQVGEQATTEQLNRLTSNLQRLLNNRRHKKLFEHCVGYILKIEYGVDRGWHAHAIFFYDGHHVQNDSFYSTQIGDYWVDVITAGHGTYWACNRPNNISRYKQIGIGMIDHSDHDKRKALLEIVIAYLAKTDAHIQSKSFTGQKLFRMGQPPKAQDVKRGRPRLASPSALSP